MVYEPNGKVSKIYADENHTQLRVSYAYDENDMRIRKTDHLQNIDTYYVYDDGGSLLAIYDNHSTSLQQKEVLVYGTDRLGMYTRLDDKYQYELKDHLGNVRVVISGDKEVNGNAKVLYSSDYYPYGSALALANFEYRYGYQGQYAEIDPETGWNNFELRMYDTAIGRWLSIDPYDQYWSPYLGMGNNPISSVDQDGGYSDSIDPEKPKAIKPSVQDNTKPPGILLKEVTVYSKYRFKTGDVTTKQFGFWDKWSMSNNNFYKFGYDLIDEPWIMLTQVVDPVKGPRHLTGEGVNRNEALRASVNTYTSLFPVIGKIPQALKLPARLNAVRLIPKLNITQFSSLTKGTFLARASPKVRGVSLVVTNVTTGLTTGTSLAKKSAGAVNSITQDKQK